MRFRMAVLACASAAGLQAQGYGQAGGSTGGGGYGGSGSSGGAAIARVAVAPGGLGGGVGGFGGGQGGFAGGTQGGFGSAGGGGLHGVTRRTFMAEPNIMAAQFFSSGGVNVASPAAAGVVAGGSGYYGAGASVNPRASRLAANTPATRPGRATLRGQTPARAGGLSPAKPGVVIAAAQAPEEPAPEPALTATQMAGVMPALR